MLALYNEHQYISTDLQNVYRRHGHNSECIVSHFQIHSLTQSIFKLRDIIPFLFQSQSNANNLINTVFI